MTAPAHLPWQAEALWRQLEPLLPGLTVEVLARCESTSSELLQRARGIAGRRSADTQPTLLVAELQTRGRGRRERRWHARAGASLTFSLALPLAPRSWSGLSLAVGLALAEALDPAPPPAPPRIGLKWPNDLWLWEGPGRGRKLGGILIETVPVGSQRLAVIGVGLNVQPLGGGSDAGADAVDEATLSQGYACIAELDPSATPPMVLAAVALPLVGAVQAFAADGLAPRLGAYARRDVLAGQPVRAGAADGPADGQADGVADGIGADGALRLRTAHGVRELLGGEISLRLASGRGTAPAC